MKKLKELGINGRGKNIDYVKAVPMADISSTSNQLGHAIKEINQSLIELNKTRKACTDGLEDFIKS